MLFFFFSFFLFSLRDQTFWKGAIGSVLKLKSEGHPQHLTDRAETGTRGAVLSPSLISMYFFFMVQLNPCRFVDLWVRFCPWSVCGGASRPVVFVRRCVWECCASPLHNNRWSECPPASCSLLVLLLKERCVLFMFERRRKRIRAPRRCHFAPGLH